MKKILKNSFLIFLICLVIYFLSLLLKFNTLRIVFPTNKSLFSYFKIIFTGEVLFSLFNKKNDKYFKCILKALSAILIELVIYVLTYFYIGGNVFLNFVTIFISILLGEVISSFFKKYKPFYKHLSIAIIVIVYYIFLYFTDKPLSNFIFTSIK